MEELQGPDSLRSCSQEAKSAGETGRGHQRSHSSGPGCRKPPPKSFLYQFVLPGASCLALNVVRHSDRENSLKKQSQQQTQSHVGQDVRNPGPHVKGCGTKDRRCSDVDVAVWNCILSRKDQKEVEEVNHCDR